MTKVNFENRIREGISEELANEILSRKPFPIRFDRQRFLKDIKTLVSKGLSVEDAYLVTDLKSLAVIAAYYTEWNGVEVEEDSDFHREVNASISNCSEGLLNALYDINYLFEVDEEEAVAAGGAHQ